MTGTRAGIRLFARIAGRASSSGKRQWTKRSRRGMIICVMIVKNKFFVEVEIIKVRNIIMKKKEVKNRKIKEEKIKILKREAESLTSEQADKIIVLIEILQKQYNQ